MPVGQCDEPKTELDLKTNLKNELENCSEAYVFIERVTQCLKGDYLKLVVI